MEELDKIVRERKREIERAREMEREREEKTRIPSNSHHVSSVDLCII